MPMPAVKTTIEVESRNKRVNKARPRLRPVRQIAILVLAGLITDLIVHAIR